MKKTLGAFGVGVMSVSLAACSSSPVAPTTGASAQMAATVGAVSAKPDHAVAAKPGDKTIVQIVLADDQEFDVLQAAVVKANLGETLNGTAQYTVFAPTDQAFVTTLGVANEAAAIQAVNGLPVETLTDILLYHVTNGRRNSNSVLAAPRYQMLNGDTLTRSALTAAGLAATDISASNGIVHVINAVLMPPQ